MTEIEGLIHALSNTNPLYLYLSLFFFAYLENLFPPAPSDLVIAFGGSLVGLGKLNGVAAVIFSTLGSTAGFITMYYIGFFLGRTIIDSGRLRWLPLGRIKQVETWFTKYGYGLVVANRFLSGTRAIISFFVGLSELSVLITLPLCAASALLWNTILVFAGSILGHNWRQFGHFLDLYGIVITAVVAATIVLYIVKTISRRKRA